MSQSTLRKGGIQDPEKDSQTTAVTHWTSPFLLEVFAYGCIPIYRFYGYDWPGVLQRTRQLGWDYWEWRVEVVTTVCVRAIAIEKVPADRV